MGLRLQLCGRLAIDRDGERIESKVPGRQGRMLLGYLVMNDDRAIGRDELADAVWGGVDPGAGDALSPLLSKLRKALGPERIEGRSEVRFVADEDTFVDANEAIEALHMAESFAESKEWPLVWVKGHLAFHIAKRPFLLGLEAGWIDQWRRRLAGVRDRGLTLFAESGLGLGGTALGPAERAARSVIETSPFNETGYRILMEVLETRGNRAEALLVYDRLKALVGEELGVDPSPALQEVYVRLLG